MFFLLSASNYPLRPDLACVQLDSDEEGDAIQDIVASMTGGRSVPRVFIDGKFIGGGDETAAAAADGTLAKLIGAPVPA